MRWHYHKDAGDHTIVRPSQPEWSTSTLRPLCKTKGYQLYMTARIEHVTCQRCQHLHSRGGG